MYRFVTVSLLILSFSGTLFSQFDYYVPKKEKEEVVKQPERHFKNEKTLSLSPNIIDASQSGVKAAGGIKFQVFLSERISLDADLVIGKNYIHGGPGILALPFWVFFYNPSDVVIDGQGSFTGFLIMAAAGLMSFEHISYHLPLKNDWEAAPYISLMRFKQDTPVNSVLFEGGQLSFATGVQMNKYYGSFFISPYIEYNIGYNDGIGGVNGGIGFGISFPRY